MRIIQSELSKLMSLPSTWIACAAGIITPVDIAVLTSLTVTPRRVHLLAAKAFAVVLAVAVMALIAIVGVMAMVYMLLLENGRGWCHPTVQQTPGRTETADETE